jgi:hypothetical protein
LIWSKAAFVLVAFAHALATEGLPMSKINAAWHAAHPMPKNPTLDQRIEWHVAHAKACGCREIAGKLPKR